MSSQQSKNTNIKKDDIKRDANAIVEDSRQSIDQLIDDSRKLATKYVHAKRGELEHYADELVKQIQTNLTGSMDKTMESLSKGLEKALDQSRTKIRDFASDAAKSLNSALKTIDAKPAIPVLVALIGGTVLGAFLRPQGKLLPTLQNPRARNSNASKAA